MVAVSDEMMMWVYPKNFCINILIAGLSILYLLLSYTTYSVPYTYPCWVSPLNIIKTGQSCSYMHHLQNSENSEGVVFRNHMYLHLMDNKGTSKNIDKIFGKVFCTCWYAEEFLKMNGMEILKNRLYWNATTKNDICQIFCTSGDLKKRRMIFVKNCTFWNATEIRKSKE